MAVRGRADHRLSGDVGGGAGLVLDHYRLAEPLGEPLRDDPRHDVGGAAGAVADDQPHRPCRIGLRRGAGVQRPAAPPRRQGAGRLGVSCHPQGARRRRERLHEVSWKGKRRERSRRPVGQL